MAHNLTAATALLALGTALWIGLTYGIFTALTVKRGKPPLEKGITGSWLLAVVATQSVSVLVSLIAHYWLQPFRLQLNFFALSMWLWGGMLYIWIISLIFYRYTFFSFSPGDLTPPYWINMGAMAISTLPGAQLAQNSPGCTFSRLAAAVSKGLYRLVLGHGDVVDSDATRAQCMATPEPAPPAAL
jgi:Voltage-dependent anion channel